MTLTAMFGLFLMTLKFMYSGFLICSFSPPSRLMTRMSLPLLIMFVGLFDAATDLMTRISIGTGGPERLMTLRFMAGSPLMTLKPISGSRFITLRFMAGSLLITLRVIPGSLLITLRFMVGSPLIDKGLMGSASS